MDYRVHATTPRLALRDYVADDLRALLAYQADPRAREFYGPGEGRPEQVAELLGTFVAWAAEEPRRNWQLAVVLRGDPGTVVGSCGLRLAGQEPGRAELGLELAPELWGRGYGTEAADAMLGFGFRELGLTSVRGDTVSANTRIAGLLGRLGFRLAGTRAGPAWMEARGWVQLEWELSADDWTRVAAAPSAAAAPGPAICAPRRPV